MGESTNLVEYEYGSILYCTKSPKTYEMAISLNNSYEQIFGQVEQGVARENLGKVNEQVNKLSKDGWNVYSTNIIKRISDSQRTPEIDVYFFIRKIKQ
jgi:hypothetical protein